MNPTIIFREPELFNEWALQKSVEDVWDYLFNNYQQVSCSHLLDNWLPDIVAYNKQDNCFLIIELKAVHTSSSLKSTVTQILGYAERFSSAYPSQEIKLLVLGKWALNQTQIDEPRVQFFSYADIGKYLLNKFGGNFLGPASEIRNVKESALLEMIIDSPRQSPTCKTGTEYKCKEECISTFLFDPCLGEPRPIQPCHV